MLLFLLKKSLIFVSCFIIMCLWPTAKEKEDSLASQQSTGENTKNTEN